MSFITDTRSNWHTWSPTYATAPPTACQTLRNYRKTVDWGYTCVFGEENNDALPFAINTACMPWVTQNVYPNSAAFYSPATACPTSWTAVSTATTGDQWGTGETGLTCCPAGFEGDGRGGCKPRTSGTFPVVQCGDADAEENESRVYTAGAWPATVTAGVTALQLRYRESDLGSASTSSGRSSPSSSSGSSNGNDGRRGGLSIGTKAAIGTVIPIILVIGALSILLLWRRRKQKKASMVLAAKNMKDEKNDSSGSLGFAQPHTHLLSTKDANTTAAGAVTAIHRTNSNAHETPEWNVELDGTEAEHQSLISARPLTGLASSGGGQEANELSGLARVLRKPIQPVEIDSTPVLTEVGDAYITYRPSVRDVELTFHVK
jgi:hypothetical protein